VEDQPTLTKVVFEDAGFDAQFVRALDTIPSGGADFGEAFITARLIPSGDSDAWYEQWTALADRIAADAERSLAGGHRVSALEGFLRATTYYRTAGVFFYRPPLDPRFRAAMERQRDAFCRASTLVDPPMESVRIPYEDTTLDGYFATPGGEGPFPTLVLVGGYDGTMEEMYFSGGVAALRRGYAILLMDGPGQGGVLVEKGLYFRPDWEAVVSAQVDWLEQRPEVDHDRIALLGRSWGGYLAPRAATAEHRVAAVIADAPQYAPGRGGARLLPPRLRDEFESGDPDALNEALYALMAGSPSIEFMFNRGMFTHGVATPLDYARGLAPYTLEGIAADITCPVLLTTGENDPRGRDAQNLYDALTGPKEYIQFTNAEGAGQHDESGAAALFSQRAFDWLDTMLGR
jgi:pimeloyl-ACP methyl ester carboxylesterase